MDKHKILKDIRMKEEYELTEQEQLLMNFYYSLGYISEMLVEESKLHVSSADAILKIREYLVETQ
jgi:hypothetical protein